MTRRKLIASSLALAPLAGCIVHAAPPAKAASPVRQGPTMDQLINLARSRKASADYYIPVLVKAMNDTGAIVVDTDESITLYRNNVLRAANDIPGLRLADVDAAIQVSSIRKAETVLVPASVLPHVRPENRGDDFPRGIPFVELKS